MHHKEFLNLIDEQRIIAAIAEVERRTSGHIRVYVSHRKIKDPMALAQKRFHKLGMDRLPEHNAVMIYIAPRSQRFALIGDYGVHEKYRGLLWNEVAAQLTAELKSGSVSDALEHAIASLGNMLITHFPSLPPAASPPAQQTSPPPVPGAPLPPKHQIPHDFLSD